MINAESGPIYSRVCIAENKLSQTRGKQVGSHMFFPFPSNSQAVRSGLVGVNVGRGCHCTRVPRININTLPGLESCNDKDTVLRVFSRSSPHSLPCKFPADNEIAVTCFARTEIFPVQGQNAPSYMSLGTAVRYTVCSLVLTFQVR